MKRVHRQRKRLVEVAIPVALLLSACRPYHMYTGGQRPPSETSTIVHANSVVLMSIDGGDTGLSHEFRLLPGPHTIAIQTYRMEDVPLGPSGQRQKKIKEPGCTCHVRLETEPGVKYVADSKEVRENSWIAWIGPSATANQEERDEPESLPHCTCSTGGQPKALR